jgi:hypothetical protein
MTVEVVKSRVCKEDIKFGTGSFTRQVGETQMQSCTEVYAAHVPIRDKKGKFTAENVEAALAEVMTIARLVNQKIDALT